MQLLARAALLILEEYEEDRASFDAYGYGIPSSTWSYFYLARDVARAAGVDTKRDGWGDRLRELAEREGSPS